MGANYCQFKVASSERLSGVGSMCSKVYADNLGQTQDPQAWRTLASLGELMGCILHMLELCTGPGSQGSGTGKCAEKRGQGSHLLVV